MKYIAAYCMVALSGKTPSVDSVKKVLESVDAKIDNAQLEKLIKSFEGKTLHEVIAAGLPKISNMSAGAAPAGNASAKVEEKKAEAKVEEPEEEEEEDVDMGDLFGDF